MQFKALDGGVYDIKTTVNISYFEFEFNNIDKAVDFLCSAVQSYGDNPEKIRLVLEVEKHDEAGD